MLGWGVGRGNVEMDWVLWVTNGREERGVEVGGGNSFSRGRQGATERV